MMNCSECSSLLYDYLDNELDLETCSQVERHIAECVVCANEWREIRAATALYHAHLAEVLPDDDFSVQVMAKLAENERKATVSLPFAVLGSLFLILFVAGAILLLPLVYPVFRIMMEIAIRLIPLPAIMLSAFPAIELTSLSLLGVALIMVTWATRRATLY